MTKKTALAKENSTEFWQVQDWKEISYELALQTMRNLVKQRIAEEIGDTLIFCQHPHVITQGRRPGAEKNLIAPGTIPVVEVERGGDLTYHGPGQQIMYPVLRLQPKEQDLHRYLRNLEEIVIQTLSSFGIKADRNGPTGVWVQGKKIASIGVAARRWVVFHGVALNVDLDLRIFHRIRPCGLDPNIMTSMAKELGNVPEAAKVRSVLQKVAGKVLQREESIAI